MAKLQGTGGLGSRNQSRSSIVTLSSLKDVSSAESVLSAGSAHRCGWQPRPGVVDFLDLAVP